MLKLTFPHGSGGSHLFELSVLAVLLNEKVVRLDSQAAVVEAFELAFAGLPTSRIASLALNLFRDSSSASRSTLVWQRVRAYTEVEVVLLGGREITESAFDVVVVIVGGQARLYGLRVGRIVGDDLVLSFPGGISIGVDVPGVVSRDVGSLNDGHVIDVVLNEGVVRIVACFKVREE